MSTLNDATSRNVLEKQHQQRKEENTHEQKVMQKQNLIKILKIFLNIKIMLIYKL